MKNLNKFKRDCGRYKIVTDNLHGVWAIQDKVKNKQTHWYTGILGTDVLQWLKHSTEEEFINYCKNQFK